MKYLKSFNTTAEYTTYRSSDEFEEPNVSLVKSDAEHPIRYRKKNHILKFTAAEANSSVKFIFAGDDMNNLPEDSLNISLQYSTDETTWNNYTLDTVITLTNVGDYVMFKGNNETFYNNGYWHQFVMTGTIKASGDITSLNNEIGGDYTLTDDYCYAVMFYNCTSLTTAPELPATALAKYCYYQMFRGCTSLITAPALPAATLYEGCYSDMFYGCTSLTTAPVLPATTLISNCYREMFNGCTSLSYIKAMFITTPSDTYTQNWVNGVAAEGTFVKNEEAEWDVTGANGIPSGWDVETEAA